MLDPEAFSIIELPSERAPLLTVVIDTEEEFNWASSFSRSETGVANIASQNIAHGIFDRYGVTPLYVVDFPVTSQDAGAGPLRELLRDRKCEIGSHLHPWVNPPFVEAVCPRNSFPGNLSAAVEREKLTRLTDTIAARFGETPKIYRAGRYGVGPSTGAILEELGYEVDTSVVPHTDFRSIGGPNFRSIGGKPYWFGRTRTLLELPLTVAWTGMAPWIGPPLHCALQTPVLQAARLQGILARARLCERIRLTPEGITFDEMRRLTTTLLRSGHRVFSLTYHSSSLSPGNTPYVRSEQELSRFLDRIQRYLDFFTSEINGTPIPVSALAAMLKQDARKTPGSRSPIMASPAATTIGR